MARYPDLKSYIQGNYEELLISEVQILEDPGTYIAFRQAEVKTTPLCSIDLRYRKQHLSLKLSRSSLPDLCRHTTEE